MKDKPMIGYARLSTDDQDLTNQRAELHAAGCTRIFAEKITGCQPLATLAVSALIL